MPAGSIPKKVEEIVAAIREAHPGYSEERVWRMAWAAYNSSKKKKSTTSGAKRKSRLF